MSKYTKGNPGKGRKPKGCKHQRTVLLDALKADGSSEEEFAQKVIKMAQEGNSTALTILSERLWQKSKPTYEPFILPAAESLDEHARNIIDALATGDIAVDQAGAAMTALRGASELTVVAEIISRLDELEKREPFKH